MRHQFKKALMAVLMLCAAYTTVHAEPMKLTYDGKTYQYDLSPISLYINSKPIETTIMPPIQLGERVVVPAREVFEPMGATVEWKDSEREVYVYDKNSLIVLKVDGEEAFVNGQMKPLDMPPKIVNNKLMIPIRFISEQLGFSVIWEGSSRTVAIEKPLSALPEALPNLPEVQPNPPTPLPEENTVPSIPIPEADWSSTLSNIQFDYAQNTLILEKAPLLSVRNISVTDLYRERKLIIHLGGDYSAIFTGGSLVSRQGRIKDVTIDHSVGTQLIVNTSTVSAVNLYELDNKIHIQFVKPSEKYAKILVLDAGHGGSDSGTTVAGVREKDLNIRFATDAFNLLSTVPDIKIYMTRETDVKPSLQDRVDLANETGASLFISIHNNYIDRKQVNGTETFYFGNAPDTNGQYFAKLIQSGIVQGLGMTDRSAKPNNGYYVLKNTKVPAVLVEVGFVSNDGDRAKLTSPDFSPRLAQIIYDSVLTYFETYESLK